VVRLLPPLNVTRETLDQALGILDALFAEVTQDSAVTALS